MTKFRPFYAAAVTSMIVAASAASAQTRETGPWDLILITSGSQAIAAASLTRETCEEGLRLAVREGHTAFCGRYIDNVKAGPAETQRYSAILQPVVTPAECAMARRMLGQVECIYR